MSKKLTDFQWFMFSIGAMILGYVAFYWLVA